MTIKRNGTVTGKLGHSLNVRNTDRMEMIRQAHPNSQFEQFTID